MKILNIGEYYTWTNPYTFRIRTGVVVERDVVQETMKIKVGDEIILVGS